MRTESDAVENGHGTLGSAEGDASRMRLLVEASRAFGAGGGTLTPSVEAGLRHDGGDAETGTGIEAAGRLRFEGRVVAIEGAVRTLLAHEASGYEEWGASGMIRVRPSKSGRGLSLRIVPTWGAPASGVDRLWSMGTTHGLARDGSFEAKGTIVSEVGYGLDLGHVPGVLTPYAGMTLGSGRNVRTGTRWQVSRQAALGVEAARDMSGEDPASSIRLEARVEF